MEGNERMSSIQSKLQPKELLDAPLETIAAAARGKGVTFQIDLADTLPDSFYCDKTKLTQVLTTLADQAVRRTSQGGVRVHFGIEGTAGTSRLLFCVEDTGGGFDTGAMSQVLDLDVPLGSWPKELSTSDSAVALRMASKLVSLLGGKLSCEGNSQTTQFVFAIPLRRGESGDAASQPQIQPQVQKPVVQNVTTPVPAATSELFGVRILVVDDVDENRALVEVLLKKLGHKISFCKNGQEAVDLCKKEEFDAILMDIQMPVLDGMEATRQIRNEGFNTRTKIIAMTASGQKSDDLAALDAGCDDCLSKPIDRKKLERKLTRIVEQVKQLHIADAGGEIVSFLEGDPDYQKAVETFVENLPSRVDDIKNAYKKGDMKDLAFKVHALKGLGGFAGFPVFTEKAKVMEQAMKSNEIDKLTYQVDELVQLCLRTKIKGEKAI
jgi:CheY-like chemotaxis protein/HPt (histidine-containing phosphotransfer) domain-containing protein